MKFAIQKKGYSVEEVDGYVELTKKQYEQSLKEQQQKMLDMKNQLVAFESELKASEEKRNLISKAIVSAVAKADEIEKMSQDKYRQEIENLKLFHDRWTQYYNRIIERYPIDDELVSIGKFNEQMDAILSQGANKNSQNDSTVVTKTPKTRTKTVERKTSDKKNTLRRTIPIEDSQFDPMKRIEEYFSSEDESANPYQIPVGPPPSDSGFSFEEALNPTQDLASIMKDLDILIDN